MEVKIQTKIDVKQFLKVVKWILTLYFRMSPVRTLFLMVARIASSSRGLVMTFLFGKLIDVVTQQALSQNPDITSVYVPLGSLLVYYLVFEGILNELGYYCRRSLRYLSRSELNIIFYQKMNELGIQTLELPEMQDKIKRADEWLRDSMHVLEQVVDLIANIVLSIASAVIIYKYIPAMVPLLVIYALIRFLPDRYFSKQDFNWQVENTESSRKARMLSNILADPKELLEIKINSAYNFLDNKVRSFYDWYNAGMIKIIRNTHTTNFSLGIGQSIFGIAGYFVIIRKTILGALTVGDMLFQFRALDNFSGSLSHTLETVSSMYDVAIKMTDVVDVFEATPVHSDGRQKLDTSKPPEIEFCNVSFKYPNAGTYVFKDLNFKFKSGENVAIVGHNGAGKTTLVKLLARVYRVSKGEILINGININDLQIDNLYKQIGVLFQEYSFYAYLSAKENIIIGNHSKKFTDADVINASINAEAHEFISEYKDGYNQILSEHIEGGIRPSTGQKQKIAIARFFFRNPSLAIFDEPTSAIDAVSEYRIFNKIYKFFRKKTVVIISHRFSTVRNADTIFVINKGKLIEEGSHQMLMRQNGYYAKAFNLQAKGYKET